MAVLANRRFLFWGPKSPTQIQQPIAKSTATTPESFYEKAIEWTHRADKVVNLVLGYLLAIASVLGFMDVLSNGQVLSTVPYLFFVWLAIMGLGVDFQLLLVVGRMPDLGRLINGWRKYVFFTFNIAFLGFLAYMSIIIGAVFTQHRDIPGTITEAMNALGINATDFVYERAALATLLLILMAVDRTMERWRMQIQHAENKAAESAPIEPPPVVETVPVTPDPPVDVEKLLQTMVAMNQQTLQAVQEQNNQAMNVIIERVVNITIEGVKEAVASLPMASPVPQIEAPEPSEIEVINDDESAIRGSESEGNFGDKIEVLLNENPDLNGRQIAEVVGCSERTARKWKNRIQIITPLEEG